MMYRRRYELRKEEGKNEEVVYSEDVCDVICVGSAIFI